MQPRLAAPPTLLYITCIIGPVFRGAQNRVAGISRCSFHEAIETCHSIATGQVSECLRPVMTPSVVSRRHLVAVPGLSEPCGSEMWTCSDSGQSPGAVDAA